MLAHGFCPNMKTTHGTFGGEFDNRRHSAFCAIINGQSVLDLYSALILEIVDTHCFNPNFVSGATSKWLIGDRNCGEETNYLPVGQRM